MVEARIGPSRLAVTVATGLAEVAFMRLLLRVAADAGGFGIPKVHGRLCMAAFASGAEVTAEQRKVRRTVIERVLIESDDIGISAFVLGVTSGALEHRDDRRAAVEP